MSKKKREDQITKLKLIIEWYEQLCSNKLDNLDEIYKLLETQDLSGLNYEEIEDLHRPVISKDIEFVIKIFQQKVLDLLVLLDTSTKIFKKANTNPSQTFSEIEEEETLFNSVYEAGITLIPEPDKNITPAKKTTPPKNCRPIFLINIDTKIFNNIFINQQQHIKKMRQ